ncbi:MAG: transcriptional regulator [Acidimicrobiales bacterium]|nr:transcriptional regulator [Acidimicrobiales bacterium]
MATRRTYGQACPVAGALDLVGERWTLLIVRDLMFGPLRFTDLRDGLPGLAPNLLSARLRHLADAGIIEPVPEGYRLTARGRDLGPVVHELARFGVADWDDVDRRPPPARLLRGALLALMAPEVLGPSTWTARLDLGDGSVVVEVGAPTATGSALSRLRLRVDADAGAAVDVDARADLGTLVALRQGHLDAAEALADGRLVLEGRRRALDALGRLLGWWPDRGPVPLARASQGT